MDLYEMIAPSVAIEWKPNTYDKHFPTPWKVAKKYLLKLECFQTNLQVIFAMLQYKNKTEERSERIAKKS